MRVRVKVAGVKGDATDEDRKDLEAIGKVSEFVLGEVLSMIGKSVDWEASRIKKTPDEVIEHVMGAILSHAETVVRSELASESQEEFERLMALAVNEVAALACELADLPPPPTVVFDSEACDNGTCPHCGDDAKPDGVTIH